MFPIGLRFSVKVVNWKLPTMSTRQIIALSVLLLSPCALLGQGQLAPDSAHRDWAASWITHPTAPLREPLVLHFRHSLQLDALPTRYVVRVSADNRFILFVNGQRIGDGPARGNLAHWRYERFDLAPFLKQGSNIVTATVWNYGIFAPVAQMSDRTAFLLESEATGPTSISTPEGWQVEEERGQHPLDRTTVTVQAYLASGPGEQIDASHYDWAWNTPSDRDASWVPAASPMRDSIFGGVNKAHSADTTGDNFWDLIPDSLPPMEYSPTAVGAVVRADLPNLKTFPENAVTIPAASHIHLLLDRKTLTTAYPRLTVSGGQGAQVRFTYSEALYDKKQQKGDRDAIEDRHALGLTDSFLPDGGDHRTFEPLWWRAWRYLDLDIQTADQPLQLESLKAWFTAYPFEERASLRSGDPDLDKIWEISWRTARLDAHETYMDTPYYEQLQYIGDTRIQALISYAVANDDRLGIQAFQAFDDSRSPDGLTRSRYPSSLPQTIPTFSLLWIGMLHDYWMYRPDAEPVRAALPGMRAVLDWYARHEQPDGLLDRLPWWSFIDWVVSGETPTYDTHGESCVTTLEYLGALDQAADLERTLGDSVFADRYRSRSDHVRTGIRERCWSADRGLLADNPDQKVFSQQANILAVLYDVVPKDRQPEVLHKMIVIEPGTTPDGIMSASYYFRFYLARALDHAGLADEYLHSLDPWRELLPMHFSTWPETPGETRSDSHAWSAHPIYDMLTLVAGIAPASPGFASVRIAPHLGSLRSLNASFPHPEGPITVEYHRTGSGLDASITLPGKLEGTLVYGGRSWPLKPGVNHIQAH
jgi:alpha-L-rhamnosidase